MSIGYVTFLMGALIACAFCLVNYIQMQSELTTKITEVSRMESELNSLKLSNDEEYSRITQQYQSGRSQENCHRRTWNDLCCRRTGNHLRKQQQRLYASGGYQPELSLGGRKREGTEA